MKLRKLVLAALAAMMVVSAAGCGGEQKSESSSNTAAVSGSITGSGSSALLPLVKDAAESSKLITKT